ncbi:hypothetical protein EB061_13485, partial [bacterium]|nr:hypothetical protein [bacterium]
RAIAKGSGIKASHDSGQKLDLRLKAWAALGHGLSRIMELYASLPLIKSEHEPLIVEAIHHLETVESSLNKGDLTYRAMLRLVLLKAHIGHHLSRSFSRKNDEGACELNLRSLDSEIVAAADRLTFLLIDLAAVMPKQKKDFLELASDVTNVSMDLSSTSQLTILATDFAAGLAGLPELEVLLGQWIACP